MDELAKFKVTTEWIKINDVKNYCFIGNEAIAFNLSSYILFKNLASGKETYYRADLERGDGVAVLAGHKIYPIFAFAENCWNAKIFIISYHNFEKISTFEAKEECIYIGLAFSETEHLIALTGMPDYKLQVWYWRTQDMLISRETELITDNQKITCSSSLPLTVAQFAYARGELIMWEIHGTQKFCKLIKRKIDLNFMKIDGPFHDVYSVEGNILIVNKHGEVFYTIPTTGSVNVIAKWSESKGHLDTCIAYLRNGVLVSGPDGNLKYFKRQKYVWNEIFRSQNPHSFVSMKGYLDNEAAVGVTKDGGIFKISISNDGEKVLVNKLHEYDPPYENFVLIYPNGNYLVTVNSLNQIHAVDVKTGEKVAEILKGTATNQAVLKANPIYPFIAVGNSDGNVYCISLLDPKNPKFLTEFLLTRESIKILRFSDAGNFLIVIDVNFNYFIISCTPGEKMSVLHHFKEEIIAEELFAIESRTTLSLTILTKSIKNDHIIKCTLQLDEREAELQKSEWILATCYNTIIPAFKIDTFYAIRSNAKHIEMLMLEEDESITLEDIIITPHQLRHVEGWNDGHHLVTWSIDGIVAVYDIENDHKLLSCFVAGNRHSFGIKKAKCSVKRDIVIALDHSGNLICSKLNVEIPNEKQQQIDEYLNKSQAMIAEQFSRTTSGGFPGILQEKKKKFIDLKVERAYQMEAEESEETRQQLFKQIEILRQKIKELLDENEQADESEMLEIQEFNLDLATTAQKEEEARVERNQQDKKMMDYIEAQSAMNQWIVEKCWSHLVVKGAKLRGMFLSLFVENYPLLPFSADREIQKIEMLRAIENSVARDDAFLAWRPIPTIELEKILIKEPGMFELDIKDTTQFAKLTTSLMGTISHRFLNISPLHYQQLDVVTFHQMKIEKALIDNEIVKLKREFNRKFDALHKTKEYQIHSIRFKNDRLRHIQNELKLLDELLDGVDIGSLPQILDPDFQPDETPDTVVNVIESEVCVSPYISPSVQKMLEEQEAARERRRKELEADDFKDRALDVMMDGVLEHKWEDEIKKNPKVPGCILKAKPSEDWTEIEFRDVADYQLETDKLEQDREKYRKMLNEEQKLLQNMLDEEIHKFNYNLCELSVEKLKFDMAVGQEEMKLLLMAFYNFKRITYQREEIEIRLRMERKKVEIEELGHLQTELQDLIRDIKTNYENLQVKDKTLEKQFKANFNETCPQAPVDQAFKYFKRRPKLQMRAQITSPILLEVAKRVSSKKSSQHVKLLPSECIDFLNGVDTLDQVSASTTGIDANSWQILCKMRRIKIESEFKIKSLGLQLADAETTLMAFMKETNNKRQQFQAIERQLTEKKENRENDSINRYVQIVMKRGLIEIPLTGSFSDFNDSVLIHRSDVADINKIILKAGRKKLLALSNAAMFRRKITLKEWEHKVLRLKVKELMEFVKTIEKCKITKEVQEWLKKRERGWPEDDFSEDTLKRQIENSINSQEKILLDLHKEVEGLQSQIDKKHKEMKIYDREIQLINVDVSERNIERDYDFEREQVAMRKKRMSAIIERAKIVRNIQNQHSHLLQLSTLLELQRLKTYPTLTAKAAERYQRMYH